MRFFTAFLLTLELVVSIDKRLFLLTQGNCVLAVDAFKLAYTHFEVVVLSLEMLDVVVLAAELVAGVLDLLVELLSLLPQRDYLVLDLRGAQVAV